MEDTILLQYSSLDITGLIDGHTHPVWAGDRVHEFAMKLAGASYMEVHKAGGGINFTVEKTKAASEAELLNLLMDRLERMLKAQYKDQKILKRSLPKTHETANQFHEIFFVIFKLIFLTNFWPRLI